MNRKIIDGQISASVAEAFNNIRLNDLENELAAIGDALQDSLQSQDINLIEAMRRINEIQRFVDSPENILGAPGTKHGEIAEHVEVGITNARQAIRGLADRASIDVPRTAPEDYILDGIKVQSKFINSTNNTLSHVLGHLDKYADSIGFGRDGSIYHIPNDQYKEIMDILSDENSFRLGTKSTRAILEKINQIEQITGKRFVDVVKPADADYADVQLNKIQDTIDRYKEEVRKENDDILKDIRKKSEKDTEQAIADHKWTVGEAAKVGAISAAIGGVVTFGAEVYKKKKEGKNISDFDEEDWRDIGLDSAKGAAKGGITGFSVSCLTNLTCMSAPVAGGYVSGAIGITSAYMGYQRGEVTFTEFIENSEMLCMDTAAVVAGSIIGQFLCPIPCLGMIIGSIASSIVWNAFKKNCNEKELELINEYKDRKMKELERLDKEYRDFVDSILNKYRELGEITAMAFNFDLNYQVRFEYSQKLALANGVDESEILKSESDIDGFFTS
ncbi:MAG: hypothetical protein IK085_01690 [Clostridia bacterium]|nr:hypothetical protein [Clostridia bacterium]